MRLVKEFCLKVIEKRINGNWERESENSFDAGTDWINDWVESTHAHIISVTARETIDTVFVPGDERHEYRVLTTTHLVLYEPGNEDAKPKDESQTAPSASPVSPVGPSSTVPTIEGDMTTATGKVKVALMAGVCGVPEGAKLSTADSEPAPKPLLSAKCDLSVYGDLFSNITKKSVELGPSPKPR